METTQRMIAYRNEVMNEVLTVKECFAKHLISDTAVISYLAVRDVQRLKEANKLLKKKRTVYDMFEFVAEKYCISSDTVLKYYYSSEVYLKSKIKPLEEDLQEQVNPNNL